MSNIAKVVFHVIDNNQVIIECSYKHQLHIQFKCVLGIIGPFGQVTVTNNDSFVIFIAVGYSLILGLKEI